MRTIDTEHNWFWQQGYQDGLNGRFRISPDEARYPHDRSDYFAGYEAGQEDRANIVEPT
jgi:ribosome modulation factor